MKIKIWAIQKTYTDECTYHYTVNLAYFINQDKCLKTFDKILKELDKYDNPDSYDIIEIQVEE